MANDQNLKEPWKPGQSGNPKGKKPGTKSMKTILEKVLNCKVDLKQHPLTKKEGVKMTAQEAIITRLVTQAMNGNPAAIESIFDRIDGKVGQEIINTHSGEITMRKRLLD